MRLNSFRLLLILFILIGLGCDKNSTAPIDGDRARWLVKNPSGDNRLTIEFESDQLPPSNACGTEAADLATWWSGELYAPVELKQEIAIELRKLRSEHSKAIPNTEIEFTWIYAPGQLIFGFTDEGWEMWKNGTYGAWDSLNIALKVDSIVELGVYADLHKNVVIYFEGRPNVRRLVELYTDLPELRYVSGNDFCCDWPTLLMWREENIVHYFFRNGWGDCPAGCMNEDYYYLTVVDGEPTYIGYYRHDWDNPMPRPDWMTIADLAWEKYWQY